MKFSTKKKCIKLFYDLKDSETIFIVKISFIYTYFFFGNFFWHTQKNYYYCCVYMHLWEICIYFHFKPCHKYCYYFFVGNRHLHSTRERAQSLCKLLLMHENELHYEYTEERLNIEFHMSPNMNELS